MVFDLPKVGFERIDPVNSRDRFRTQPQPRAMFEGRSKTVQDLALLRNGMGAKIFPVAGREVSPVRRKSREERGQIF
jgi:hypothetical protein